jgi:ribose transport system ATP-binding protein
MTPPRLIMSGVAKSFGPTRALAGVDMEVQPAAVHALIGENGAGKSTLMQILSGATPADRGTMLLDGAPFRPRDPRQAREGGVAMIYQELMLAPELSVEANILLGMEPGRAGWIRSRRSRSLARAALADLDHADLPLEEPAGNLAIADQQIVEIARALVRTPKLLVMDEPTSSLGPSDTRTLFRVIARLKDLGVSVVYISHFLEECAAVCDTYTVLRDGAAAGSGVMEEDALPGIIELMVGRRIQDIYPPHSRSLGEVALSVRDLRPATGDVPISFTVRRGEIFGVAGLVGSGRTETLRTIFGVDRRGGGTVAVGSHASSAPSARWSLRHGASFASENRKADGLLLDRSVADNLTLTRLEPLTRFALLSRRLQRQAAEAVMARLDIRADDAFQSVRELSGGNQQKTMLGRLLHHDASVLLLDEPTRGVDIGSKVVLYRAMHEEATLGKAIVFVSAYLPELLGVCDTVGVMCRGRMTTVRPAREWTEHTLMQAAVGAE